MAHRRLFELIDAKKEVPFPLTGQIILCWPDLSGPWSTDRISCTHNRQVVKSEMIPFEDLGTEAIRRLAVHDFLAIVANDVAGRGLFAEAVTKYAAR